MKSVEHSLFSLVHRIVGGIETLSVMEAVPTDEKDRPQVRLFFQSINHY